MNKELYTTLAKAKYDIKRSKNIKITHRRVETLITTIKPNTNCYNFLSDSFVKLSNLYNKHMISYYDSADADPPMEDWAKENYIHHLTYEEHQLFQENASKVIDMAIDRFCQIERRS